MLCVILGAKKQDGRFGETMAAMLTANFGLWTMRQGRLWPGAFPPELLLTDWDSLGAVPAGPVVLVAKDDEGLPPQSCLAHIPQAVAIVSPCSQKVMCHMAATGLPAITCGFSSRDTITLSSMPSAESASGVISLQRAVTRFDGSLAEPQEWLVRFPPCSDQFTSTFAAMAAAAVCLMAGRPFAAPASCSGWPPGTCRKKLL